MCRSEAGGSHESDKHDGAGSVEKRIKILGCGEPTGMIAFFHHLLSGCVILNLFPSLYKCKHVFFFLLYYQSALAFNMRIKKSSRHLCSDRDLLDAF